MKAIWNIDGLLLKIFSSIASDRQQFQGDRISEYIDTHSRAVFVEREAHNPLWSQKADCAFPCATENEINRKDAEQLMVNGVGLIVKGASMPSTELLERGVLCATALF